MYEEIDTSLRSQGYSLFWLHGIVGVSMKKKKGDLFMLTRLALVQHIIIYAPSLGRSHIIILCGFIRNPFAWVNI